MEEAPQRAVKTDEAEKLPKECSQCHFVKPAGIYICPKCGFKPLAGEDVETDKSRGLKKVSKAEVKYTAEQKQSGGLRFFLPAHPRSAGTPGQ